MQHRYQYNLLEFPSSNEYHDGFVGAMGRYSSVFFSCRVARNAMKSFFSPLKMERTARKTYGTRDEAKTGVFDYIERRNTGT